MSNFRTHFLSLALKRIRIGRTCRRIGRVFFDSRFPDIQEVFCLYCTQNSVLKFSFKDGAWNVCFLLTRLPMR